MLFTSIIDYITEKFSDKDTYTLVLDGTKAGGNFTMNQSFDHDENILIVFRNFDVKGKILIDIDNFGNIYDSEEENAIKPSTHATDSSNKIENAIGVIKEMSTHNTAYVFFPPIKDDQNNKDLEDNQDFVYNGDNELNEIASAVRSFAI